MNFLSHIELYENCIRPSRWLKAKTNFFSIKIGSHVRKLQGSDTLGVIHFYHQSRRQMVSRPMFKCIEYLCQIRFCQLRGPEIRTPSPASIIRMATHVVKANRNSTRHIFQRTRESERQQQLKLSDAVIEVGNIVAAHIILTIPYNSISDGAKTVGLWDIFYGFECCVRKICRWTIYCKQQKATSSICGIRYGPCILKNMRKKSHSPRVWSVFELAVCVICEKFSMILGE